MPEELAKSVARWEVRTQTAANNLYTQPHDRAIQRHTRRGSGSRRCPHQLEYRLGEGVSPGSYGFLLIAGEALSHCVRATVLDLFSVFTIGQCVRTILLQDCMSSVPGFEAQAQSFLDHVSSKFDVNIMTTEQAMYMFTGN